MHRTRSSLSYDFLSGDLLPANMSSILASLSYFPPPPPFILGPPPRRSWTCSSQSSCLTGNDRNPFSIRPYVPISDSNQSMSSNDISPNDIQSQKLFPIKSLWKTILEYIQNHPTIILILSILISLICLFLLILLFIFYWQRKKQRRSSTITTNNSHHNSTNNIELNYTKRETFYHRLIPYHRKHKTTTKIEEKNSIRLRNHLQDRRDSPVAEVVRLSIATPEHQRSDSEFEETL